MTTNVRPFPVDSPMPVAPEAERSLLGALLLDASHAADVFSVCRAEWFQIDRHRVIFQSIERLYEAGKVIDYATIVDDLRTTGTLDTVGDPTEITALYDAGQRLDNLDGYVRIIREKAQLRGLAKAGSLQMSEAIAGELAPDEIARRAAQRLERISAGGLDDSVDEIAAILERLHETVSDPKQARGVPTGFAYLDNLTNGIGRQALWLLAAYTSVGKSSFAASIALHAAAAGYWVDVLTYEITREEYAARLLSVGWGVDLTKITSGYLSGDELERYRNGRMHLASSKIRIAEASGMTTRDIRNRVHRFTRRHELDLLIVDYLGLISAADSRKSETESMNQIARDLKTIAGEGNCALLALHQINREGAKSDKGGTEPQLWWLRYAGEAHANAVMFLTREEKSDRGMLYIKKNRSGPIGQTGLKFTPQYARFEENMGQ